MQHAAVEALLPAMASTYLQAGFLNVYYHQSTARLHTDSKTTRYSESAKPAFLKGTLTVNPLPSPCPTSEASPVLG